MNQDLKILKLEKIKKLYKLFNGYPMPKEEEVFFKEQSYEYLVITQKEYEELVN